jgi:hypothetical protein
MVPESSLPPLQIPANSPYPELDRSISNPRSYKILRNIVRFYGDELLATRQAGGQPLVGCQQLFIEYSRNFPCRSGGGFSIRILGRCHAILIGAHLSWTVICMKGTIKRTRAI